MKTIIIEPLKPDYKTIDVRTTSVEEFMTCQYKFKFNKPMYDKDVLKFGKQVHEIVQADLADRTGRRWDRIMNEYTKTWEADVARLWQYRSLFREWEFFQNMEVTHIEKSMYLWIELGDYLVVISWVADIVWYYQAEKFIADIKTVDKEWTEDMLKWKLQGYMYPFIDEVTTWIPAKYFRYAIGTKHVNPRAQEVDMIYNTSEAEVLIKELASMIVDCTRSWVWIPNKWFRCNRCPLKKTTCPKRHESII